jgi:uncharacterized membrane protein
LRGHWWKAVLATVVFLAITYIVSGPYTYNYVKLQAYTREVMPTISSTNFVSAVREAMKASMSLAQDPKYLEMQTQTTRSMGLFSLASIFLVVPLGIGFVNAFLRLFRQGDEALAENMFKIATKNYWHKVWGGFLMSLFIALWSLLLIIPGIVKAFSYAMTPFILEENPELSANEAIDRSRAMMKGHKFDLFWLILSFIGWYILCILTLGIGFLWLAPYQETAIAAFYEDVKADYEINGGLI